MSVRQAAARAVRKGQPIDRVTWGGCVMRFCGCRPATWCSRAVVGRPKRVAFPRWQLVAR